MVGRIAPRVRSIQHSAFNCTRFSRATLRPAPLLEIDAACAWTLESKQPRSRWCCARVSSFHLRSAMPIYEYECKKCHHRFERIQKFSDPHVKKCPQCGGAVEQVLSAPAVQFKGSGWYVTDYARKSGSSGTSSSSNGDSKKEDSGKKEEKKENKAESSAK